MQKKYVLLLLLGMLSILIISFASYFNFYHLIKKIAERRQIFTQEENLLNLFSSLKDAETGQRGYIITARNDYLEPYYNALKNLDNYSQNFKSGISQTPQIEAKFSELKDLIQLKLNEMKDPIEIRKAEGFEKAQQAVINNEGKRYMDSIRSVIDLMIAAEKQEIKNLDKEVNFYAYSSRWTLILGIFVANFLVCLYSWFFYRDSKHLNTLQANLKQTAYIYKAILDSTKQALIRTDLKGIILSFNKGAEKMLGFEADELVSLHSILDLYDKQDLEIKLQESAWNASSSSISDKIFETLVSPSRYLIWTDSEWIMKRKNGTSFPCLLSITALKEDSGASTGYLFVGTDISENKKWGKELKIAHEAMQMTSLSKNQFLASLGYGFRPPLMSISNTANALLRNKNSHLNEQELANVHYIVDSSNQLLDLINRVVDISKNEEGTTFLVKEKINLYDFINGILDHLSNQNKEKQAKIQFVADIPTDTLPLETDAGKLKTLLIYLVQNILNYLNEGQILIQVKVDLKTLQPNEIDIIDNSIEESNGIFSTSHFQLDDSFQLKKRSTSNVELSLAQSIAKMLGYHINSLSQGENRFIFRLMLNSLNQEEQETLQSKEKNPINKRFLFDSVNEPLAGFNAENFKNFKVLVIDNDLEFSTILASYLREFGCQVFLASTGEEALKLARKKEIDLITMDILISPMSGYDLVQHLQNDFKLKNIPFAFISVVAKEIRGKIPRAIAFLNKPITKEDLQNLLQKSLSSNRLFKKN